MSAGSAALGCWIGGIESLDGNVLRVTHPVALDDEAMEHIPPSSLAILVHPRRGRPR